MNKTVATKNITTKVWMPLYKEIQCLCVWFVGKIMDSNGHNFALFVYSTNTCIFIGQETMAVDKIISVKLQKDME